MKNLILRYPYFPPAQQQGAALFAAAGGGIAAGFATAALAVRPLLHWLPSEKAALLYELHESVALANHPAAILYSPLILTLPAIGTSAAIIAGSMLAYRAFRPRPLIVDHAIEIKPPRKLYAGDKNGVSIGEAVMSRQDETNGLLLVAGQGGGKTVPISALIEQSWERGERALILDGKPEFAGSAPNLHGDDKGDPSPVGAKTWLLALADTRAARWRVGEDVYDRATASRWAGSLVSVLDTKNQTGGDFWVEGAQVFIETAILMCIESFGTKWGLGDFYKTLMELISLTPELLKETVKGYLPGSAGIVTVEAEQTLAGFLSNLATAIRPIDTMVRFESLKSAENTISIRRWLKSRDHLIIGSASTNMRASAAFANGLIELAAEQLLLKPDASPNDSNAATWLFLDEFGAAGRCDLLRKQMVKLRSKRVRVVLGIQSLQQISEEYGEQAAQIILGSIDNVLIGRCRGGGKDGDAEWASAQLGKVIGRAWINPTTPQQIGQYEHIERELVPPTAFERLGAVYKRKKVVGVRLILKTSGKAAELFIPVKNRTPLRSPIKTAELKVSTPLHGRVAPSLLKIIAAGAETPQPQAQGA